MNRAGNQRDRSAAGLRGRISKSLIVKFAALEPLELTAEVDVPETLGFSARTLRWHTGGPAETRTVDVTVRGRRPVRLLSADGDSLFRVSLETLEEGRRYRLRLAPEHTARPATGALRVRTDAADPRDSLAVLFMLIRDGGDPGDGRGKGGSQ